MQCRQGNISTRFRNHHANRGTYTGGKNIPTRYRKYEHISIRPHLVGGNWTGNGNIPRLILNLGIKIGNGILWHLTDNENCVFWDS